MITFDLFDKIITAIKEQDDIDRKVDDALELLCDSWVMMNTKNKKYWALGELLKVVMNDKDDFIGWWLYEDVEKEVTLENNKKINLSTTKSLYEYLIQYYKEKNEENK